MNTIIHPSWHSTARVLSITAQSLLTLAVVIFVAACKHH